MPPAASVAYADAISSGVTSCEPSVVDAYGVMNALRLLRASRLSGTAAIAALEQVGVDRIDIEAAIIQWEDVP